MAKVVVAMLAVLTSPLVALFALVSLVGGAASSAAAAGQAIFDPSAEAIEDIPPQLLSLYFQHASTCAGLPWQVVAGIGKVESNHARFGDANIGGDGVVRPAIIGIPLNGQNGTAAIADTDRGVLDGDRV